MSIEGVVQTTGPFGPTSSGDTFPTHIDIYCKGGLRNVGSETERNNIPKPRRTLGMIVGINDATYWKLSTNSSGDTTTNTDWTEFETGGGGDSPWTAGTGTDSIQTVGNANTGGISSGGYSVAEGRGNIASGDGSHAEGGISDKGFFPTSATSYSSHAEGVGTLASGRNGSHAEGWDSKALSISAHAEGQETTAIGEFSHSEGGVTIASGDYSHTEGRDSKALSIGAHAEGFQTTAGGSASHAEGGSPNNFSKGGTASGEGSHAEGVNTTASGDGSHAEGSGTIASGRRAHAEGVNSIASGDYSHAEGQGTTASGNNSHAEGEETMTSGLYSHAGGWGNQTLRLLASGTGSFNHSYQESSTIQYGVYGNNSAILGGTNNYLSSGATNSVLLGGIALTGVSSSTVYVPNLNIKESFTPSGSGDTAGEVGMITWDNTYTYIKTNTGWGRTAIDYVF